jgi:hypothetical protein
VELRPSYGRIAWKYNSSSVRLVISGILVRISQNEAIMNLSGIFSEMIIRLSKRFCWPICRAYARHLGDKSADGILRLLCGVPFAVTHRFWPNFVHPKRFTEKLWSRMLHERDSRLTMISDKLAVRDYVAGLLGERYLVPLLWRGDNPERIPLRELPNKFVIKTNHGCGYNIIAKDKTRLDSESLLRKLKKWLSENYCADKYLGIEWGYKNIKPCIIIESFIENKGKAPVDYKFWCFSGRVESISIHFDRFEGHKILSLDGNLKPGGLRFNVPTYTGVFSKPQNFDEMIRIAERLSDGFKFLRVDLYKSEEDIYFGELTPYPGGTTARFLPVSQDYLLGEKWM